MWGDGVGEVQEVGGIYRDSGEIGGGVECGMRRGILYIFVVHMHGVYGDDTCVICVLCAICDVLCVMCGVLLCNIYVLFCVVCHIV